MAFQCSSCKKEVTEDDKAMQCDLCESWEHVSCLRGPDKLDNALYDVLTNSCSKALLYVCTRCRVKGSLSQRLFKLELENEHLNDERLASAQSLHDTTLVLEKLRAEHEEAKARWQEECQELRQRVTRPAVNTCDISTMTGELVEVLTHKMKPLEEITSSCSDEDNTPFSKTVVQPRGLQPRGFKELRFRIDKFSGKGGTDDFEVWVEDYKEATAGQMSREPVGSRGFLVVQLRLLGNDL